MSERLPLIEALEGRSLMSGSPFGASVVPIMGMPGMSKAQGMQTAQAAAYQAAVKHAMAVGKAAGISPSIEGTWKGTVTGRISFSKRTYNVTLDVTDVTAKTATGTLTVGGRTYTGTFKGVTKKTEEFSYTYAKKGSGTITINGLLNGLNTGATGMIQAKYHGWAVNGYIDLTKTV